MTSPADICNRALSEIGSRTLIGDIATDNTPAGVQCRLFYTPMRRMLLRGAPWAFARKTIVLTELGNLSDGTAPYPWLMKYAYPADCLKNRYILPPASPVIAGAPDVSVGMVVPWCAPSRQWRYLVGYDDVATSPRKVLLANVPNALAVYTADVTDPDLWDPLFENAMVMGLASKLVIPLTGNVGLKASYVQLASDAVLQARVADGNESIPTTDHVVDWMAGRNDYGYAGLRGEAALGEWYWGFDQMNWGM